MRRRYRAKRDVLVGALHTHLPEVRIHGTAAGLHLLAQLPDGADERAIALRARDAGVGLHELHRHCTNRAPFPPALLLGFALPGESELAVAAQLLAGAAQRGALACAP
jgi:GntR family transcriptional regulator/MocR family aminotransferase